MSELRERAAAMNLDYNKLWQNAYKECGVTNGLKWKDLPGEVRKRLGAIVDVAITKAEEEARGKQEQLEDVPPDPEPADPEPAELPTILLDKDAQENIAAIEKGERVDGTSKDLMTFGTIGLTPEKIKQVSDAANLIARQTRDIISQLPAHFFVIFGDTLCLCAGAYDALSERGILPISVETTDREVMKTKDGYTEYIYYGKVVNRLTGLSIPVVSTENTGNKFWANREGKTRTPDEIDHKTERDCRQAAFRGLVKEAYKLILRLRGIKVADAEKAGMPVSDWLKKGLITKAR